MGKLGLLFACDTVARVFLGPSPEESYEKLMREKYGVDVKNDLPTDEEVKRARQQIEGAVKDYSPLLLEEYAHDFSHYDGKKETYHLSIAFFNQYWEGVVFRNIERSRKLRRVYIKEIPDPRFNAFCIKNGRGILVVFNRGLALFITRAVKLLLGCTRLIFPDSVAEATISIDQAGDSLKTEIRELVLHQRHFLPLPLESELHIRLYPTLIHFIQSWVCAHEIGHCISKSSKAQGVEAELEADKLGFSLYVNIDSPLFPDRTDDPLIKGMQFAAPHLFFTLSEAFESHGNDQRLCHPPSSERSSNLMRLGHNYTEEQADVGRCLVANLNDMLR
jgi:hypothetical protein